MLEGKLVDLRIVEKEDLPLLQGWFNALEFSGRYNPVDAQQSRADLEKVFEKLGSDRTWFIIQKKDGTKIGFLGMRLEGPHWEIGYAMAQTERCKGYCTEAVSLAVDYLFASKEIVRIQAATHVDNMASQKVLEKAGFKREGTIRKGMFAWGTWHDLYLYSILREEWKEPKILTKAF